MKTITDRITINEDVCNGKPTIRGKRITVQTVLEFLGAGDIAACLQFASSLMDRNYVIKSV